MSASDKTGTDARTPGTTTRHVETDVTVYGATGFVGRHVCKYLLQAAAAAAPPGAAAAAAVASATTATATATVGSAPDERKKTHPPPSPPPLRITLAGRNGSKLRAAVERLRSEEGDRRQQVTVDTFVADSQDVSAVRAMASRTVVVLNCAGPFATYGTTVVEACAEAGADYVDITGEVGWAGNMRERFGKVSERSGSRIVSFCGFDSIPSDLAVYVAISALRKERRGGGGGGGDVNVHRATTWHSVFGFANGGTIHTALDMPVDMSSMFFDEKKGRLRRVPFFVDHPFHLASVDVKTSAEYDGWRDEAAKSEWLNQLFSVDTELARRRSGLWASLGRFWAVVSTPFFMAPVNAKVVNASAVALKYNSTSADATDRREGATFAYRERYLPAGFFITRSLGLLSAIPAITFQFAMLAMVALLKLPLLGKRIAMWIAPPGSGIPDAVNEMGFAEVYAEAHSFSSKKGKGEGIDRGTCRLVFKGDPGNLVTAQCVGEAALSLVLNREDLPPKSKDGFGTPAQIMGDVLVTRLTKSSVRPVVVESGMIMNDEKCS